MRKSYALDWNGRKMALGPRTLVMGILNVTPDSFSDGGSYFSVDHAVAQGERLIGEGADILDIGGESTRPFSNPVPAEEEIRRVVPVIRELSRRTEVPISIDTTKAVVARQALDAGAVMINDVAALRMDPDMGATAAEYDVPVILMHMLGTPRTMQASPRYDDLLGEIVQFLADAMARALPRRNSAIQHHHRSGIGFGKTVAHNLELVRRLEVFHSLDVPVLIGPSRKAFIRKLLGEAGGKSDLPPDLPVVETGTQAVIAASILRGAHIVRVHDVANTRATATIIDALCGGRQTGGAMSNTAANHSSD